jgi:hypothetical protein
MIKKANGDNDDERRSLGEATEPPANLPDFITCKFRLAAAAAIIGGVRCQSCPRPLPA